ncbi:PREDICTED: uncharacterized protein LOC109114273 [Nelumbo nucifera]|uniref:Uncharacterized protein LOC109114273 n=1 Tax=Nelumbo nucifera TaxID=4432 RepID=A0A1U8Q2C7_NELNU|nr:PREDICTED: uncharacterized protein LOC109114273 [Nelumbo nucifera]
MGDDDCGLSSFHGVPIRSNHPQTGTMIRKPSPPLPPAAGKTSATGLKLHWRPTTEENSMTPEKPNPRYNRVPQGDSEDDSDWEALRDVEEDEGDLLSDAGTEILEI